MVASGCKYDTYEHYAQYNLLLLKVFQYENFLLLLHCASIYTHKLIHGERVARKTTGRMLPTTRRERRLREGWEGGILLMKAYGEW